MQFPEVLVDLTAAVGTEVAFVQLLDEFAVPQVDFAAAEFDLAALAVEVHFDDAPATVVVPQPDALFSAAETPAEFRLPRSAFKSVPERHPKFDT